MKKIVGILVCILIFFSTFSFLGTCKSINENTIYVDDDGGVDYTSIQEAIDNANNNDIIYVYSGMYFENIIVDKSIELIGENKDTTFIDGSGLITLFITSNNVKVNDFTIQNTNKDYPDNCRGICIYSNDVIIYDNTINNNEYGIVLTNSSNIEIYDNYFIDNNWAIVTMSSRNVIISNNIVNFNENEKDYYVHHCGISIYESTGFSITHNIINSDDGLTLSMEFISDANIYQNRITGSFCGIILRGSNNVIISENTIENNRHGIELSTSAGVEIIRNNFIGNKLNAFFSKSIIWDITLRLPIYSKNIWNRNYWDRFRLFPYPIFGGIGWVRPTDDFVYHPITWITFDLHPAKEPYDIT